MHLRGSILYVGVWMSSGIVEKVVDAEIKFFPWGSGNGRSDGADCRLHGVVNCTAVVIEKPCEFLTI